MNYKDLQEKAKTLGLPYVGVSRVELMKTISEKSGEDVVSVLPVDQYVSEMPVSDTSEPTSEETEVKEKVKRGRPSKVIVEEIVKEDLPEDMNTATVYDGSYKIRAYTLEVHGKEFISLAKMFVEDKPKFRVVYTKENPIKKCPNCGAKITCGVCGKEIA